MLRFLLALIVGLALSFCSESAQAFPGQRIFGFARNAVQRVGHRVTHPFNGALRANRGAACGQSQATSGPACSNGTCTLSAVPTAPAQRPTNQRHTDLHNRDAQGVANLQAHYGRVGHHGGNPGYEGCGMASTPEQAYSICCYGNSGMRTVDVGYARAANGMWFCCRRYGR